MGHGGPANRLTDFTMLLHNGDVVVCSTGGQGYVLTREIVQAAMKARRGRCSWRRRVCLSNS